VRRDRSVENEFSIYVGLDWGTEIHQACVLDALGRILRECRIEHTGQAITTFLRALNEIAAGDPRRVAMAIEVPRGPVVEAFLEGGFAVFSINPKQLDRFRDRHTVAGAKDDSRDAYVLADSLRTDQHCFRRIEAQHPDVVRLRELSRTEESLGADFRRAVNQLYQLLLRYYPQLLRLNSTPDEPWIWALLELAPAPQRGARLTLARLRQLLAKHRIRRWSAEEVREVLQTPALPLAAGTAEAVSEHVLDRAAKANKSSCDVAAVRGFEMRCIIGRAAAFNTTHPPNFTMLACARPGTITDGHCVVLPTACLPC
jgi:hypothetical protein